MMKIPVMVIDDETVDRYTAKRRLDKHGGFDEVVEVASGDQFLEKYCNEKNGLQPDRPLLILIDINMPGRNGFETIAEFEKRQKLGVAPQAVVVMMFTSSGNPKDKAAAASFSLVRGYIEKPLDATGAEELYQIYRAAFPDIVNAIA